MTDAHGTTEQQLCPHGLDRRVMWCVWCEDPARMTGAAPAPGPVVFATIRSHDALFQTAGDHAEARRAGESHRDVLRRWTPDILALQIDAYTVGYLDGIKAERNRASNEFRPKGPIAGTTAARSAAQAGSQERQETCGGSTECGTTTKEQSGCAVEVGSGEETTSQIQCSGKSILEGRER